MEDGQGQGALDEWCADDQRDQSGRVDELHAAKQTHTRSMVSGGEISVDSVSPLC